jgi:dTDP-4-dehydrorhamnose reductase
VVCDQHGGPTPAEFVARVILIICNSILTGKAVWGTYHLSGMPHTTWYGFAQEIINVALESRLLISDVVIKPIVTTQYKTLAKRPPDSRLSNDKIEKVFQIKELSYKPAIEYVISQLDNQEECHSI